MGDLDKTTTMGLFHCLKPSLMMVRTSPDTVPEVHPEEDEPDLAEGEGEFARGTRLKVRRRSSMSDLDKARKLKLSDRKLGLAGGAINSGSIGDLMNLKFQNRQSSSMESVIARTMPLTTVTRPSTPPPALPPEALNSFRPRRSNLTCTERAERFSRLLNKQKSINVALVRFRTLAEDQRFVLPLTLTDNHLKSAFIYDAVASLEGSGVEVEIVLEE